MAKITRTEKRMVPSPSITEVEEMTLIVEGKTMEEVRETYDDLSKNIFKIGNTE